MMQNPWKKLKCLKHSKYTSEINDFKQNKQPVPVGKCHVNKKEISYYKDSKK